MQMLHLGTYNAWQRQTYYMIRYSKETKNLTEYPMLVFMSSQDAFEVQCLKEENKIL